MQNVIVGGGLKGVCEALKRESAVLLEKESQLGGRLRLGGEGEWGYGQFFISKEEASQLDQIMKEDPEGKDLYSFENKKLEHFGVLQANNLKEFHADEIFQKKGLKALGGHAAVRNWAVIEKLQEAISDGKRKDQSFSQAYSGTRKDPAYIVLEQYMFAAGIPDLSITSCMFLFERMNFSNLSVFKWDDVFDYLHHQILDKGNQIEVDAQVIGATKNEDNWTVSSRKGQFIGEDLVVSHSGWDALDWLPKNNWPIKHLQYIMKSKPVSSVVLSIWVDPNTPGFSDLPDMTFIPAESTQVVKSPFGDICFQATLDYEISLQAPDVVKAIKRLKRAKKRVFQFCEELNVEAEHVALVPVSWAEPISVSERRQVGEPIGDKLSFIQNSREASKE